MCFQPGECSRGLLRDCNRAIFAKVRLQLYSLLFVPRLEHGSATRGPAKLCCMLLGGRGWSEEPHTWPGLPMNATKKCMIIQNENHQTSFSINPKLHIHHPNSNKMSVLVFLKCCVKSRICSKLSLRWS